MKLQSTWNPLKPVTVWFKKRSHDVTIDGVDRPRWRHAPLTLWTSMRCDNKKQTKRRKQRRICTYICTVYVRKNLPSAVAPRRLSASTWVFPNARDPSWFASPGLRSPGRGTSSAPGEDSPHPSWEDLLPKPPPYVADGFLLGEIGSTWTFFTWF